MIDFISSRGCVYVLKGKEGAGTGYSLPGFPPGGLNPDYPIIITDASVTESDIILPAATLNNEKVIYTFGEDFGNVQIHGIIFLGAAGKTRTGITPVVDYFKENGAARSAKPVNLSMPGNSKYKVFLQSLQIMQGNAALNTKEFLLSGITAEPPM